MFFGIGGGKRRFARAAQPTTVISWPLNDSQILASASSRPRKCNGTLTRIFESAARAPGNDDGGIVAVGAARDFVLPGNGPFVGFLAGSRKALRRARASSSVMPCRSHRFKGAKSFGGLQGSTKTGNTKFGLAVTESHCAAPRSQLE
jgi:hypothetical protein